VYLKNPEGGNVVRLWIINRGVTMNEQLYKDLLSTLLDEREALRVWLKASLPYDIKQGMEISLGKIGGAIGQLKMKQCEDK
jgi:hypothetical protein